MKMREVGTIVLISSIVVAAVIGYGASQLSEKPDGPLEEAAEDYIADQTGIDFDFTPDSEEDDGTQERQD